MARTFLRREDVERLTGLPRSTIYDLMAKGRFPKSIKIGAKAVAWIDDEIAAWQELRIAACREEETA